jgi:RNase H-fold protein (predicted Holliday junction resolvase)
MKKKDRRDKGIIDRISAVVILQDYLEEIKNK